MAVFTGVQHMCTFSIVVPLIYHIFPNVRKASRPSVRPSLLMFRIDYPIARISSSLALYQVLAVVLSLWQRDRNRIDSYQVSTVDVPESPIASGARGQWQQQRCDCLHCHEESWGSVPPRVVVFSWALDEGGAAGTCSSRQHLSSAWRYSVLKYYPINAIRHNEHHLRSLLCRAHFLFIWLAFQVWFVWVNPGFVYSDGSSKKVSSDTPVHRMIIVQEHRHPLSVAKISVIHLFLSLNPHIFHCIALYSAERKHLFIFKIMICP